MIKVLKTSCSFGKYDNAYIQFRDLYVYVCRIAKMSAPGWLYSTVKYDDKIIEMIINKQNLIKILGNSYPNCTKQKHQWIPWQSVPFQ